MREGWSFGPPSRLGSTLMLGGGACLLGGTAINFALVNPTFADIEAARSDPFNTTRADADELTERFDRSRYLTIGLVGTGMALVGTGVFIDLPIRASVGPGQLVVSGNF